MSLPVNYYKKYVQKVKIQSLSLFVHKNGVIQPGLANVQSSTCTTYKKCQLCLRWLLTPKLGMVIHLHIMLLLTKYFKSSHYRRKLSNGSKQASMACVGLVYEAKIIGPQASFPKLAMLFEVRSCYMYLLHSYATLQHLKSLQVPFNPFSNSCLSKTRVKIWNEKPYIGEFHAVTTKFRNKLLSFHYLKK